MALGGPRGAALESTGFGRELSRVESSPEAGERSLLMSFRRGVIRASPPEKGNRQLTFQIGSYLGGNW